MIYDVLVLYKKLPVLSTFSYTKSSVSLFPNLDFNSPKIKIQKKSSKKQEKPDKFFEELKSAKPKEKKIQNLEVCEKTSEKPVKKLEIRPITVDLGSLIINSKDLTKENIKSIKTPPGLQGFSWLQQIGINLPINLNL